jgi:hypothetical protein
MTIEQIMAWLDAKGATPWGAFDLSQPQRKLEAAIWFHTQMRELAEFGITQAMPPYPTYTHNALEGWDVV